MQTAVTYVGLIGTVTDLGFSALYVREGARQPGPAGPVLEQRGVAQAGRSRHRPSPALCRPVHRRRPTRCCWPSFAILVLSGLSVAAAQQLYAMQRLTFEIIEIIPETLIVFALVVIVASTSHADTGFFLWAYAISYAFACVYFGTVLIVMGVLRPALSARARTAASPGCASQSRSASPSSSPPSTSRSMSHPAALPAVRRGGLLHARVQALRVAALHPVRAAQRGVSRARRCTTGDHPRGCYHWRRSSSRRWSSSAGRSPSAVFLLAPQFNSLLHFYPRDPSPALQILSLAIVFMFADNTFAATLNAIDKQNVFAFVAMVGLVINVGVNLVVIPRYGYLGASWAVVVTEAALVVVGWFVLRAQLGTIRVISTSWKAIVAGAGDGCVHLRRQPAPEPASCSSSSWWRRRSSTLRCLLALRVADREEISLIRNALRLGR